MIDILLGDITDGRDAFHRLFVGCSLVAPRNSGQDGNENDDDDGGPRCGKMLPVEVHLDALSFPESRRRN